MTWASFRACSCTHWSKFRNSRKKPLLWEKWLEHLSFFLSLDGPGRRRNLLPGRWLGMACLPVPLLGSCCPGLDASGWLVWFSRWGNQAETLEQRGKLLFQSCIVHYLLFARRVLVSLCHTHSSGPAQTVLLAALHQRVIENRHRYRATALPLLNMEISHQLRDNLE